jgi:transcriptional regulator with XRE-family HTH domain
VTRASFTDRAERFRKLLIAAREESGLTQVQVAGKLKKPQSYVSKIERGERRLDVIEFFELAEVFKIDPLEFLRRFVKKS